MKHIHEEILDNEIFYGEQSCLHNCTFIFNAVDIFFR